jgi:hypothetical protein
VLNGTQVIAPVQLPVNVTGNAISAVGGASASSGNSSTRMAGTSAAATSGNYGVGNGTQVVAPVQAPVKVTGNSVTVGGAAASLGNKAGLSRVVKNKHAATPRAAGSGTLDTSGNYGALNGTQVYVPVQVPVNVCGNSVGAVGQALAACGGSQARSARAMSTKAAAADTSGNYGILNGTQVYAPVQVPVKVCGNAVGAVGVAEAVCTPASTGGGTGTPGSNSGPAMSSTDNYGILNGTQVYAPVKVPVNVVGNAVSVIGAAAASGR